MGELWYGRTEPQLTMQSNSSEEQYVLRRHKIGVRRHHSEDWWDHFGGGEKYKGIQRIIITMEPAFMVHGYKVLRHLKSILG